MITFRGAALALSPLALLLSGTSLSAQDAGRMDRAVAEEAADQGYMGTALVAIGDEILLDKGYGSANLEWEIANTPDTKFRLGSITKQFTAVSALKLHEDGLIDIDQPISTYLEDIPASWEAITVADLLHHTSGIPNITSFDDFRSWKFSPATLDELIARFADRDLEFEPGSKWAYSNSGYMVLVAIIEKASRQSLEDYMQATIFEPLEMTDTGADVSEDILPRRASGYSPTAEGLANAEYVHMSIPRGGGNLYSTTRDLLKWQRGLFGGAILSPATLDLYTQPAPHEAFGEAKYAAGVLVEEIQGQTTYWHGGGIEGFNTWLGHDPASDITVIVLANVNGGSANKLGRSLMTMAKGGEVELASERVEVGVDPESLTDYTGTYVVTPQFALRFFVEDGQFMTQATGQEAFPVFAKAEDEFFLKVVDARLVFNRNAAGDVTTVTLFQNGNEIEGVRE